MQGGCYRMWCLPLMGDGLHALQHCMRAQRHFDANGITRAHVAACKHNAHDARLAHEDAMLIATQHRGHEPVLKSIQLCAWVAETHHFNNGAASNMQLRAGWQTKQVNAAGCDVLANLSGQHIKTRVPQLIK